MHYWAFAHIISVHLTLRLYSLKSSQKPESYLALGPDMVKVNSRQKISVMSNRVKAVWNDFKLEGAAFGDYLTNFSSPNSANQVHLLKSWGKACYLLWIWIITSTALISCPSGACGSFARTTSSLGISTSWSFDAS